MKSILVTGASGYVGSKLVPQLLARGYRVIAVDKFWFGDFLETNEKLVKINGDVRTISSEEVPDFDSVIHLAAIANDPSVDLDPVLSWEIGTLGTLNILNISKIKGASTFILASSGSVYGIKDEPLVTETLSLVPISVYNKVKMIKEKVVQAFEKDFRIVVYRPATVCGYSPRMRLDLAVNALTFSALSKGEIEIYGGSQMRPQVHIEDLVEAYIFASENKDLFGVYNIGFENDSILDIANKVASIVPSKLKVSSSNDLRSYRLSSQKILDAGFYPKKTSFDAVLELKMAFEKGVLVDKPQYYNVNWMKNNLPY